MKISEHEPKKSELMWSEMLSYELIHLTLIITALWCWNSIIDLSTCFSKFHFIIPGDNLFMSLPSPNLTSTFPSQGQQFSVSTWFASPPAVVEFVGSLSSPLLLCSLLLCSNVCKIAAIVSSRRLCFLLSFLIPPANSNRFACFFQGLN